MILTYKLRHNTDFSTELKQAFKVAEFAVNHPRCRSSKEVKEIGLKSAISNQILKKYGNQKTIKQVHNVNLVVPNQAIKVDKDTRTIRVVPLKLVLNYQFPDFQKVNQIELDKEFAYISCTIAEQPEMIPQCFIGVDRNTTGHVAVTANPDTGKIEKFGKSALHIHRKYSAIRKRLQREGKFRELKRVKDRESRIVKDLNHKISRKIVDMAKVQHAALVFEDLNGIRQTRKQHRSFKYALHSWSFFQLQTFVEYKAKLLGVPVLYVDPAYTSQDCSRCGVRGQRIGKDFKCPTCGHVDHADVNAAFNIALKVKDMIDRTQKEMCTMGALIPHDAMLECPVTLEPHAL
jgi:putative transposase